jgi:hypothetical protein
MPPNFGNSAINNDEKHKPRTQQPHDNRLTIKYPSKYNLPRRSRQIKTHAG